MNHVVTYHYILQGPSGQAGPPGVVSFFFISYEIQYVLGIFWLSVIWFGYSGFFYTEIAFSETNEKSCKVLQFHL